MKRILILVCFIFLAKFSFGQNTITVNGKVIGADFIPLPYVKLLVNKEEVTTTDFDGKFMIEIDKSVNKIQFQFIGMQSLTVTLKEDCKNIEVILLNEGGCYLGASMQKVNRIRKRNFKKGIKLYKTAFEKGLFSSEKLCGEIQFEPYK